MPDSDEAAWLRENWNRDGLGQFDRRWIAVLGREVVASAESLDDLYRQTADASACGREPLVAFVVLGPLQS